MPLILKYRFLYSFHCTRKQKIYSQPQNLTPKKAKHKLKSEYSRKFCHETKILLETRSHWLHVICNHSDCVCFWWKKSSYHKITFWCIVDIIKTSLCIGMRARLMFKLKRKQSYSSDVHMILTWYLSGCVVGRCVCWLSSLHSLIHSLPSWHILCSRYSFQCYCFNNVHVHSPWHPRMFWGYKA